MPRTGHRKSAKIGPVKRVNIYLRKCRPLSINLHYWQEPELTLFWSIRRWVLAGGVINPNEPYFWIYSYKIMLQHNLKCFVVLKLDLRTAIFKMQLFLLVFHVFRVFKISRLFKFHTSRAWFTSVPGRMGPDVSWDNRWADKLRLSRGYWQRYQGVWQTLDKIT